MPDGKLFQEAQWEKIEDRFVDLHVRHEIIPDGYIDLASPSWVRASQTEQQMDDVSYIASCYILLIISIWLILLWWIIVLGVLLIFY